MPSLAKIAHETALSRCIALILAVLLLSDTHAQPADCAPEPDGPHASSASGHAYFGTAPFRVWHQTTGYGQEASQTAVGARGAGPLGNGVAFVDGQLKLTNDSKAGLNIGVGFRWLQSDTFTGSPRILGVSGWYDGDATSQDNYFNQLGVSLESLGDRIDFRLNANFPLEAQLTGNDFRMSGDDYFYSGNTLVQNTLVSVEHTARVVEYEVAARNFETNSWIYGGGYQLDGNHFSAFGYKAGVRGYLYNDLALDLGFTEDDVFGANVRFGVVWFPGRTTQQASRWRHTINDRMREPVYRNTYVAFKTETTAGGFNLRDEDGDVIRVVHVDSNATAPGDGTFERPLTSLDDVFAASRQGDIVLAYADSTFSGQSVRLRDEQRFLGEGGNEVHTVVTSEMETVELPESSPGAAAGAIPEILNAAGDAIVLAPLSNNVADLAGIEVSNVAIDGGTRGITAPGGVGDVNINRVSIANTVGNGIELTPLVETLDSGDTQVRFNPTISEVTFLNVGGDDIHLDATTGEPDTTPVVEGIVIADVSSTDGQGVGIDITNNKSAVSIQGYAYDGGATGNGALRFSLAEGNISVSDTTIQDGAGPAVALFDSEGSHTFSNVTISDPGAEGVLVVGGSANMNFIGKISQANAVSTLAVNGGHTGSLFFSEATVDEGVIEATNGDGLQFNDADGVYTFNDAVTLNGGDAGIDILNDSAAVLTFNDAEITNPTGTPVNVDGGSANMSFNGMITQNNDVSTLLVSGGHTGSLVFGESTLDEGVIEATSGDGLQFNDADGVYTFTAAVNLNGGDAAIDILNDSAAVLTFTQAEITNPTGTAINVDGGSASISFNGMITQNNDATTLLVTGGHTGTFILGEFEADSGVIVATNGNGLQFNDADGAYTFNHSVQLNGGDAGIDIVNDSDATITLADAEITGPTGVAVNVDGGNSIMTFTGKITQGNNVSTLVVSGGHTGTLIFNENEADGGVIAATNGDGLQFNNADGDYAFNHNVMLEGGDAGIDVVNDSSGTLTFSDGQITNPTGNAFVINGSNATISFNGTITNDAGQAVVIDSNTGGSVAFTGTITDTDQGLLVQNNTGGTYGLLGQVNLNTGANDALTVTDNSGSNVRFNDLQIETTSGTGLLATNTDTLAVSGLTSSISSTTGVALDVSNVEIAGSGASFGSISADGAVNGIVLNEVTGGTLSIGINGSSPGDGGTIENTTGAGILITNAAGVSLNNMQVENIGGDGISLNHTGNDVFQVTIADSTVRFTGGRGIDLNTSGSGTSRLTLRNNAVDNTTGEGVYLDINGAANEANITLNGNTINNSNGEEALLLVGSGNTIKTINLLVEDNNFTNNDPTAVAADFQANGAVNLNATLNNSVFTNSDAASGRPMEMSANNAAANVRLSMTGNTATAGDDGDDYFLIQNSGTFRVENLTTPPAPPGETIFDVNTGTFDLTGTITDDPGDIPQP